MKRIRKALAIGGSAITLFGLGALPVAAEEVDTVGDVNPLVEDMRDNVDNVEVVTGTAGADISDGVQAAKIASVLVNQNYEAAVEDDFELDADANVTVEDPTVTIERTEPREVVDTTGFQITDSIYSRTRKCRKSTRRL